VFIYGESVNGVPLEEATVFHLGANGPALEFVGEVTEDGMEEATQSVDMDSLSNLSIDTEARDAEVREVVDSPFFRQVRKQASAFRGESDEGAGQDITSEDAGGS
jgi:hypothetical protein